MASVASGDYELGIEVIIGTCDTHDVVTLESSAGIDSAPTDLACAIRACKYLRETISPPAAIVIDLLGLNSGRTDTSRLFMLSPLSLANVRVRFAITSVRNGVFGTSGTCTWDIDWHDKVMSQG